jgi:hypothetical protein
MSDSEFGMQDEARIDQIREEDGAKPGLDPDIIQETDD